MANGGWIIVLVIIALAITTGFMVSMNNHLLEVQDVQHAALISRVEVEATLYAKETEDANTIHLLETKVVDLNHVAETQTAEHSALQQREREMADTVSTAQAVIAQSGEMIRDQKATQVALSGDHVPPSGGDGPKDTVVSADQATRSTKAVEPGLGQAGVLPVLALGLFTTVVIGAYRMLKTEDRAPGQAR